MPVELQIIRACDFVRMGTQGEFDFEKTREALTDLASACRRRGVHRALIDVRHAHSNLSPNDIAALVTVFSENAVSKYLRLAIVYAGRQSYRTKLFVFFSSMRARKVRAFEDFEEALVWLSKPDKIRPGEEEEEEDEFEVKPTLVLNQRSGRKPRPSNN
jgi:hypothetical protein